MWSQLQQYDTYEVSHYLFKVGKPLSVACLKSLSGQCIPVDNVEISVTHLAL